MLMCSLFFFFSSRRRHTRYWRDWSSDVCSSDLETKGYRILAMEDCLVIKENFYPHNFSIEKALDENEGAYVIAKSIINFIENANEEKNARKSMFREVCFVSQGLGSICKRSEERRVGK